MSQRQAYEYLGICRASFQNYRKKYSDEFTSPAEGMGNGKCALYHESDFIKFKNFLLENKVIK